jgi:hypothetical protein|tara:strand:+ start:570 stop:839 length:270 start_codon:yes stop_codon:yes gene_type:complete
MLETLTWEFKYALLACSDDGSDDIVLEDTYYLELDEINSWYERMKLYAMSLGKSLLRVGTYLEGEMVFFTQNNITGDIEQIDTSHLEEK